LLTFALSAKPIPIFDMRNISIEDIGDDCIVEKS